MTDPILPLAGLSPADGKAVVAKFDGGLLSSDGGVLALREAEQRLGRWRTISLELRIAVGTLIAERPPHGPVRARFGHTVLTSGV